MRLATWNVNSVRSRLDHVLTWLETAAVDVLCLQETKVIDEDFPIAAFADAGYHVAISGQKSYNGVAIASREPLSQIRVGFGAVLNPADVGDLDDQKRVIAGRWRSLQIVNLYVPNGSELGSEKYDYKLRWLATLRAYLAQLLAEQEAAGQEPAVCVGGDFNIAFEDRDIHNAKDRDRHIMASDPERAALQSALFDLGFSDAFRRLQPDEIAFSWWDYRAGSFPRNRGWRIDHWYLSPGLVDRAQACSIDPEPRTWAKPSDHAPVILDLDLSDLENP